MLSSEQRYMIHLLACAIREKTPENPPDELLWGKLYELSDEQKILPIIFDAVRKLPEEKRPPADLLGKWGQATMTCAYFFSKQVGAMKNLFEHANVSGADMLALKGYVIRELYPVPELRTMSDCDVIIKKEQLELVKNVFAGEGYSVSRELETTVEFGKENFLKFETFYEVFSGIEKKAEFDCDMWKSSKPLVGERVRKPSNEDMLVHLVAHLAKHARKKGAGVRNIADIVLFIEKNIIDFNYVIDKLKLLNLEKFFYGLLDTARVYFDMLPPLSYPRQDEKMLEHFVNFTSKNSVYGVMDNVFIYDVKKAKGNKFLKIRNYIERFFPPVEKLTASYTYAKKRPVLLPVAWVHRLFKAVFIDKRSIKTNIDNMRTAAEKIEGQTEFLEYFDLD